jgi:hypothetical protein
MGTPCAGQKGSKRWIAAVGIYDTIRSAVVLEYASCIDSPRGLAGASGAGRRGDRAKARKFHALFGVMIKSFNDQPGGNA